MIKEAVSYMETFFYGFSHFILLIHSFQYDRPLIKPT